MPPTMPERAASRLPERAERVAKAGLRGAKTDALALRKTEDRDARRAVLGEVLETALVLLRLTRLKQQAAFLGRDDRQVARWFNGSEAVPWEELLVIRELQFPLAQALLESCQADLVEIQTTIRRRQQKAAVA